MQDNVSPELAHLQKLSIEQHEDVEAVSVAHHTPEIRFKKCRSMELKFLEFRVLGFFLCQNTYVWNIHGTVQHT